MSQFSNLKKLFTYLLESCSEDGYWKDSDDKWPPVITTLSCELLLKAGISVDSKWNIIISGTCKEFSLLKCFQFLNGNISTDGSFGTDLWDATRLGRLISGNNLSVHFSNYDRLRNYIISCFETSKLAEGFEKEWMGPGFNASGIEYLDLEKNEELSNKLLINLLAEQENEGYWIQKPSTKKSHFYSVWHTSQAIITLKRKDPHKYQSAINKGMKWLVENRDNSSGSWTSINQYEIYFTSYAILALSGSAYTQEISEGVSFLEKQITEQGQCSDKGGTIMCALAFWELFNDGLIYQISFIEYLLSGVNSKTIKSLEDKIKNREKGVLLTIRIKKRHIEIFMGIIAVIAFVIAVLDHFDILSIKKMIEYKNYDPIERTQNQSNKKNTPKQFSTQDSTTVNSKPNAKK